MYEPSDENGKILRARMLQWMKEELENEPNASLALRKALLASIFVAPSKEPAVARFVEYLLTDFIPLSAHFSDDIHPFMGEQGVRRFDNGETVEMMVHQSLPEAVMAEPISAQDIFSAGLRLPWDVVGDRFVGCFQIVNYESLLVGRLADLEDLTDRLRDAVDMAEEFGPWKDEPEGPLHYLGCWLRYLHISDRIFIFTRDMSSKSHLMMILASQRLFMNATEVGIGLRGGIASGECITDFEQQIHAGQPLLDADALAQKQAWFGVALHSSMDGAGKDDPDEPAPDNVEGWIPATDQYETPTRSGVEREELSVLNWAMLFRDDPEGLDRFLEPLQQEHDPHLHSFYRETRRFGREMIERMRFLATPRSSLH